MEQPVTDQPLIFAFGPYELDAGRLLLLNEGEPLAVGPKVVETLLALIERAGEVITKDALLDRIWPEGFVEEANLAQNIYVLRKALRAHWDSAVIETIPRRGYRFVCPVRLVAHVAISPRTLSLAPPISRTSATSKWRWPALAAAVIFMAAIGLITNRPQAASAPVALSSEGAHLYMLGRYYWNLRTAQSLKKSLGYFKAVTVRDPKSALGYAGVADAYSMIADYNCRGTRCAAALSAQANARRALSLDPNSAEAHTSYGMTMTLFEHKYGAAEDEYRTAIALNPKYALAHQWFGTSLLMAGRMKQARRELESAISLQPVATAANAWLGTEAYFDHRYPAAVEYNRLALDLNPQRVDAWLLLGLSQEQLGAYREAYASLQRFGELCKCKAQTQLFIAGLYAKMGHAEDARAALNSALAGAHNLPPDEVGIAFIQLGDRAHALSYMRHVHFKDHHERLFLALDPRMDPVRSDSRFRPWTNAG